ncbi:hypothetical protein NDU88_005715 [Pleurodeles waltl]|uniref:Uncharacterized protein n=1 Tax=Pleurodeles waltl TaxID=8319 RepID=A0AAV7UJ03_PLEWA|nr:hypothetical protein NDU88_005715 [Pleurodeles waltl]
MEPAHSDMVISFASSFTVRAKSYCLWHKIHYSSAIRACFQAEPASACGPQVDEKVVLEVVTMLSLVRETATVCWIFMLLNRRLLSLGGLTRHLSLQRGGLGDCRTRRPTSCGPTPQRTARMLHAALNSGGPCCVLVGPGLTGPMTPAAPRRSIPRRGCAQPVTPAVAILGTCPGSSSPLPRPREARRRRVRLASLHSCRPLLSNRGRARARSAPV